MSGKIKRTEYSAMQGAMVKGLSNGKGMAVIGTFGVGAGQQLSASDVLKSNMAQGLEDPQYLGGFMYRMITEQEDFGFNEPARTTGVSEGGVPEAQIVSRKAVYGEQTPAGNGGKQTAMPSGAQIVSKKAVFGIQNPTDGGTSLPNA